MSNKIEIETLVKQIVELNRDKDKTMECEIATPKMMRQLYKELGEPNIKDYPEIYNHIRYAKRVSGYTKYPRILTKTYMKNVNGTRTSHIKRMSQTKEYIVEKYERDGWSSTVYSYNVICSKYVPHKDYENVWIEFVSTRDCSRYEYILVEGE